MFAVLLPGYVRRQPRRAMGFLATAIGLTAAVAGGVMLVLRLISS